MSLRSWGSESGLLLNGICVCLILLMPDLESGFGVFVSNRLCIVLFVCILNILFELDILHPVRVLTVPAQSNHPKTIGFSPST